jgi:hypothetical protein
MTTFLIIFSAILLIAVGVLSYLLWVSYRKVNAAVKYAEWYASFIFVMLQKVRDVKMEMDIIDQRGSFRADDEVGTTFEALQEVINDMDEFIKANLETTDGKEEK